MPVVVRGDLLQARQGIVCHQTNCTTIGRALGLARALFESYPYADSYRCRNAASVPGTNNYMHPPPQWRAAPIIVNMNAQRWPGKPSNPFDTPGMRLEWFERCLIALGDWCRQRSVAEVAMPEGIGCGLAGGDWGAYRAAIERFEAASGVAVVLFRL